MKALIICWLILLLSSSTNFAQIAGSGDGTITRLSDRELQDRVSRHPRCPTTGNAYWYQLFGIDSRGRYNERMALREYRESPEYGNITDPQYFNRLRARPRTREYYLYRSIGGDFIAHQIININGVDINVYNANSEIADLIRTILSPIFSWHLEAVFGPGERQNKIVVVNYTGSSDITARALNGGAKYHGSARDDFSRYCSDCSGRRIEITIGAFMERSDLGRTGRRAEYTLLHEFGHALQLGRNWLIPNCVSSISTRDSRCLTETTEQRCGHDSGTPYPHIYALSYHGGTCTYREQTAYAYMYYWMNPARLTPEDRVSSNDLFRQQAEARGLTFTPR